MAGFPRRDCVICGERFELVPGKPGFANVCPECTDHSEMLEYPVATQATEEDGSGWQKVTRAELERLKSGRNLDGDLPPSTDDPDPKSEPVPYPPSESKKVAAYRARRSKL